jgi:hypothetical protein
MLAGKLVNKWDKDTIPGIEVNVKVGDFAITGLSSCAFNDQTKQAPILSVGRGGIHSTATGERIIQGKLTASIMTETKLTDFAKSTENTALLERIENGEALTLADLNEIGGIDVTFEYIDRLTNSVYRQTLEGIVFDELDTALGVDVLKQEETYTFRCRNAIEFRKVTGEA